MGNANWKPIFVDRPSDDKPKMVILDNGLLTVASWKGSKWVCSYSKKRVSGVCFWIEVPEKSRFLNSYKFSAYMKQMRILKMLAREYKKILKSGEDFDGYMLTQKKLMKRFLKFTEYQYTNMFNIFKKKGLVERVQRIYYNEVTGEPLTGIFMKVNLEKVDEYI